MKSSSGRGKVLYLASTLHLRSTIPMIQTVSRTGTILLRCSRGTVPFCPLKSLSEQMYVFISYVSVSIDATEEKVGELARLINHSRRNNNCAPQVKPFPPLLRLVGSFLSPDQELCLVRNLVFALNVMP